MIIYVHTAKRNGEVVATIQNDNTDAILSFTGHPEKTKTLKAVAAAKANVTKKYGHTVTWSLDFCKA